MRFGTLTFGNWCKSTEMALYASVPKVAIAYQTPLIFLGENPTLSWGSAGGSFDGDANRMKYTNTLQGGDLTPYYGAGMTDRDLFWYRYPTDAEMERANLRLVCLGYYIRDFNDYRNSDIAIETVCGYALARMPTSWKRAVRSTASTRSTRTSSLSIRC